jgi:hypothetical protein
MPLVFVHGVSVRDDPVYYCNTAARDALFRRFVLDRIVTDPGNAKIFNPYWGRYGATFAWDHASLPRSDVESLGPEDDLTAALLSEGGFVESPPPDAILVETSRRFSLEEAVDILWAVGMEHAQEAEAKTLAELAAEALSNARANPRPAWLDKVTNDQEFLEKLEQEIGSHRNRPGAPVENQRSWEALGSIGTWDRISEGASRIRDVFSRLAGQVFVGLKRSRLQHQLGLFLGDIFVYLKDPRQIVGEIANALLAALQAIQSGDEKLLIVGHSMGGNIVYDVLTHLLPTLPVDVFVTVGSQVAFFEELKLFASSNPALPNEKVRRVAKPANVQRWINVFDRNDLLGFAAEGVFDGVSDFAYSTGKGVLAAHGTYFARPSFHVRLADRIGNT